MNLFSCMMHKLICVYLMTVKQKRNKNAEHLTYLYAFLSISSRAGIEVPGKVSFCFLPWQPLCCYVYHEGGNCSHRSPLPIRSLSEACYWFTHCCCFLFFVFRFLFVIGTYVYKSPKLFNPKNSLKSVEDFHLTVLIKR